MDPREMSANFLCPAWGDSISLGVSAISVSPKVEFPQTKIISYLFGTYFQLPKVCPSFLL